MVKGIVLSLVGCWFKSTLHLSQLLCLTWLKLPASGGQRTLWYWLNNSLPSVSLPGSYGFKVTYHHLCLNGWMTCYCVISSRGLEKRAIQELLGHLPFSLYCTHWYCNCNKFLKYCGALLMTRQAGQTKIWKNGRSCLVQDKNPFCTHYNSLCNKTNFVLLKTKP